MGIQPQTARRFEKSSAVARYWLAQCEGFRVKGAVRGTVEEVVGSGDLTQAETLVVRTPRGRRRIVVGAVDAVIPAERLIVTEGRPEPTRARERRRAVAHAVARGRRSGAHVMRLAGRAARAFALLVGTGLLTLGRIAKALAVEVERLAARSGERMRADLGARQLAAAERRRRAAAAVRPPRDTGAR